jgi:hypothetical protein
MIKRRLIFQISLTGLPYEAPSPNVITMPPYFEIKRLVRLFMA